MEKMVVEEVEL